MNFSWFIARRFRQSKSGDGFLSFISASSILGIALGCFVLILILSVMNGFENQLKEKVLSLIPHGELRSVNVGGIQNWQNEMERLTNEPEVQFVSPLIKLTGLLQKGKASKAVEMSAIEPTLAGNEVEKSVLKSQWQQFLSNPNSVLLGKGVMKKLLLTTGDKVQLMLPELSQDGRIKSPKVVWLTVAGEVAIGGELDNHIGYMHLPLAAQLSNVSTGARSLEFRFNDPFKAPELTRKMGYEFSQHVYISDWTRTQGHLYQDIKLVRVVVYIALTLLIAVACFNIVSTLVMSVNEKQSEIAILKTMGASDSTIIATFVFLGAINGLIGLTAGVLSGVLVADNVSHIATTLESAFGVKFLSGDIYFIDFLPSDLHWQDVVVTAGIALLMSLLATIYPAIKASKIDPARGLGH